MKVSKIVGISLGRDYGDVDVLAWNLDTSRVLLIECKDLQLRKTFGEVAEQLADYRGELRRDGKRDDLRKHLDRFSVLSAHAERVAAFLRLPQAPLLEAHLVFKNPVPMSFAWERMKSSISLSLFEKLDEI